MGELSIKIRIADRDYPMRVSTDDQDKVRLAGKQLNDKIKTFKEQFGVEDKQDLLAMVAFDGAVEKVNNTEQEIYNASDTLLLAKIAELDNLVSSALVD
ncbi:MAG TPA: cell division protein ZapA [Cytophagaceae bacterium]|jgi:cell division protein ZapA|nr:cell division protein ZapA [Cytophagaceae bacterium]